MGKGDKSLTGPVTVGTIDCNLPSTAGLQIFVLGQFGSTGPALNMHVSASSIDLFVSTGAGANFHSRSFKGAGVQTFDPARGTRIDSTLTEVTGATENPKGIGKLASLSGSIDCGNQVPGTSTLVLDSTTPDGTIQGPLDPVRVGCSSSKQFGDSVQTIGVGKVGTTPVTAIVNVTPRGFTVFLNGTGIAQYFYSSTDPATASITEGGAHISGDAATTAASGESPVTIHVDGAVVCGTTTSGP